jgi:hypothetical protein
MSFSAISVFAQNKSNALNLDSIRMANKARLDSIKLRQAFRKDSLQKVREQREAKKKLAAKEKKRKLKEEDYDTFVQVDYSPADSLKAIQAAKRDSMKTAREELAETRRREIDAKREITLARKKIKIEPLTQEMSGGFRLCSDGWVFFVQRGSIDEENKKRHFFTVDIGEKKHPKETRSQNENFSIVYPNEIKPVPYKYGKVNNFYQFKMMYGSSKELTGRLDKKSVIINWVYNAGLSLGMLKPYYLDLLLPEGNGFVRKYEKYSDEIKDYFLDLNNRGTILGGSSFTKGISEIKIKPGLCVKSGFYFDYSTSRKSFLGVEIGASAEFYANKIEMMKNTTNSSYFFNFYADIRFGKRWE